MGDSLGGYSLGGYSRRNRFGRPASSHISRRVTEDTSPYPLFVTLIDVSVIHRCLHELTNLDQQLQMFSCVGGESSQSQQENLRAAALANAQALREITERSPDAAALTTRS